MVIADDHESLAMTKTFRKHPDSGILETCDPLSKLLVGRQWRQRQSRWCLLSGVSVK